MSKQDEDLEDVKDDKKKKKDKSVVQTKVRWIIFYIGYTVAITIWYKRLFLFYFFIWNVFQSAY